MPAGLLSEIAGTEKLDIGKWQYSVLPLCKLSHNHSHVTSAQTLFENHMNCF